MRPSITPPASLARQHELIDAAIAVNEAPTVDGAFQVLVEAGIALLSADRLWVVVWSDDLTTGVIRAVGGASSALVGERVPSDPHSVAALLSGEPYVGEPILDGLAAAVRAELEDTATRRRSRRAPTSSCSITCPPPR